MKNEKLKLSKYPKQEDCSQGLPLTGAVIIKQSLVRKRVNCSNEYKMSAYFTIFISKIMSRLRNYKVTEASNQMRAIKEHRHHWEIFCISRLRLL